MAQDADSTRAEGGTAGLLSRPAGANLLEPAAINFKNPHMTELDQNTCAT